MIIYTFFVIFTYMANEQIKKYLKIFYDECQKRKIPILRYENNRIVFKCLLNSKFILAQLIFISDKFSFHTICNNFEMLEEQYKLIDDTKNKNFECVELSKDKFYENLRYVLGVIDEYIVNFYFIEEKQNIENDNFFIKNKIKIKEWPTEESPTDDVEYYLNIGKNLSLFSIKTQKSYGILTPEKYKYDFDKNYEFVKNEIKKTINLDIKINTISHNINDKCFCYIKNKIKNKKVVKYNQENLTPFSFSIFYEKENDDDQYIIFFTIECDREKIAVNLNNSLIYFDIKDLFILESVLYDSIFNIIDSRLSFLKYEEEYNNKMSDFENCNKKINILKKKAHFFKTQKTTI